MASAPGSRRRDGLRRREHVRAVGATGRAAGAASELEHRLVVNATGPDTVRLLPPLNASDADLDEAVSRVGALL